jgi:hypothetical protein
MVAMDFFYQSCVETDLSILHYVTFIEPFGVLPTEALSFHSDQFTSNYANKIFESKNKDPFLLLEKHFFDVVVMCKKNYDVKFEDLPHEIVEFFHSFNISAIIFVVIKCFRRSCSLQYLYYK